MNESSDDINSHTHHSANDENDLNPNEIESDNEMIIDALTDKIQDIQTGIKNKMKDSNCDVTSNFINLAELTDVLEITSKILTMLKL